MKELLAELEKKRDYWLKEVNSDNDIRSDSALGRSKGYEGAIDLINKALEGKVIATVEPTDEMLEAAVSVVWASGEGMMGVINHFDKIYKAMIATQEGADK